MDVFECFFFALCVRSSIEFSLLLMCCNLSLRSVRCDSHFCSHTHTHTHVDGQDRRPRRREIIVKSVKISWIYAMFIFHISMSCYCAGSQFSSSRSNILCTTIAFLFSTIRSGAQKSINVQQNGIVLDFYFNCNVLRSLRPVLCNSRKNKGRKGPSAQKEPSLLFNAKANNIKILSYSINVFAGSGQDFSLGP